METGTPARRTLSSLRGSVWLLLGSSLLALGLLLAFVVPHGGEPGASTGFAQPLTCGLGSPAVCVRPASQVATTGTNFSVDVVADQVTNLGAYEFTLSFDPSVVSFVSFTNGPFLGSTGRGVSCFPPRLSAGGVRIACVTTPPAGPPGPAGPSGAGLLATLVFSPAAPGLSTLGLTNAILADITGSPMLVTRLDGDVTVIQGPTSTPCDGVCPTPIRTPTPTATRTPPVGPIVMRIEPPSQTQLVGSTFPVDVVVENVSNLASYEFTLVFNSKVLGFVGVSNGPFLGSTGRGVVCPAYPAGMNTVRFACVTAGASPPGPGGSGVLAELTFQALGVGGSPLEFVDGGLSDPLSVPIPASLVDGTVTVVQVTATPCPGGVCPTSTVTPTPTITPTPIATPAPSPCVIGSGTDVCIQPDDLNVAAGSSFSVDVAVDDVANLGGFKFTIVFDPDIVAFVDVVEGTFLGSTGRTVSCVAPSLTVGSISFGCGTLGPAPPGPSGSGKLAAVTFVGVDAGTSALLLNKVELTDISANLMPLTRHHGSVTVFSGPSPTPGPTRTPTVTPTVGPTSTTRTLVDPPSQTVAPGPNFDTGIVVEGVANLASYEWILTYDPAVVGYVSVVNGSFLGSTGRFVFCPSPILGTDSIRFACATTGASPPPPSGSGVLSLITFSTVAEGTSNLDLTFVSLSDPLAEDIPTQIQDGSVTVSSVPAPTPTETPVVTATPTATDTPTATVTPGGSGAAENSQGRSPSTGADAEHGGTGAVSPVRVAGWSFIALGALFLGPGAGRFLLRPMRRMPRGGSKGWPEDGDDR